LSIGAFQNKSLSSFSHAISLSLEILATRVTKMERVIIGSSNVYRFYRPEVFKDFKQYNMVRCTDIVTFKAVVENLEAEENEVIISVLENFLERSVGAERSEEGIWLRSGETLQAFTQIIKEASTRLPNTKFVLADPITRPKLAWYQEKFDTFNDAIGEGIGLLKRDNITRIEGIAQGCQQFENDQVHLTPASGQIFIEGLLTKAEVFFRAPLVNLVDEEMNGLEQSAIDKMNQRLSDLEGNVRSRQMSDNLIFARIREEMDTASNKQKEDRVVITGITSEVFPPNDPAERKTWIRKIVTDIFLKIDPNFKGVIHYVNQGKTNGRLIPLVEVKLDSAANSLMIRKAFSEKKKGGVDMGRIFVSNSVNLATRVRVDILKALARKVADRNTLARALPFVSRPVLQIRPAEGTRVTESRSFTFTEAISKYGHLLKQFELGDAYRRAGNSFKGQLEQQFIVLRDRDQHQLQRPTGERPDRHVHVEPARRTDEGNRKRVREDDDEVQPSYSGGHRPQRGSGYKRPWRGNRHMNR
jgi:hypothetical protein